MDGLIEQLAEAVRETPRRRPPKEAQSPPPPRAQEPEVRASTESVDLAAIILLGLIAIAVGIAIGLFSARLLG